MLPFAPMTFALLSERGSPRIPVPHGEYNFNNTHSEAPNSTTPTRPASNYTLVDLYNSKNFFSEFAFFKDSDPTHGFVKYVDYQTANNTGLIGYVPDGVKLGVDAINNISTTATGRNSVRVTSKKNYTEGLFIADIYHMPSGLYDPGDNDNNNNNKVSARDTQDYKTSSCGLWPAFWTFGPDWPASGEIDILEGVNTQVNNSITLHSAGTSGNGKKSKDQGGTCDISSSGSATDTNLTEPNCASDTGCKQDTTGGYSSTDSKAEKHSGNTTTATTTTTKTNKDATVHAPVDPSNFGTPLAAFVFDKGCSLSDRFKDHNIVFNTAFCGDWAGKVWDENAECKAKAATCKDYVAHNPASFKEAYWVVNSIKVYQLRRKK
ncbi:concanavalin A-like lectin/glucanase domain-containing protein [Sordaria brevicollis]|uniref:Concanavalin A-like lectin/glucanase domain-containing protein n=1 Tax=Sordaria brevicollis TaxID=83679 RepID=A0AAE0PDA0_SORBR|nr:concanavalin A-like lectin/glucanase domain-containing protein [Sordaria brevicollis]